MRNFEFVKLESLAFDLSAETSTSGRVYATPTGEKYPSITTVLSSFNKKALFEWRKRVGEEEANRIAAKASRRGTKLHTVCENYLLGELSEPEYRFETLTVQLEALSSLNQTKVLGLEIGDVCQIKFTPNNVGTQIDKFASIIRIDHDIQPASHRITFGFQTLDYASLVLDDLEFGILDTGRLGF